MFYSIVYIKKQGVLFKCRIVPTFPTHVVVNTVFSWVCISLVCRNIRTVETGTSDNFSMLKKKAG